MRVSIIAAHDMMRVIGFEGGIPWHIPADLKRFKELTTGKAVIMGRKTFESIGKPLPNRVNIVITSDPKKFNDCYFEKFYGAYESTNLIVVSSYQQAISAARSPKMEIDHAFIIGGQKVYKEAMKTADDMYITVVFGHYEGDTYFPAYPCKTWKTVQVEEFYTDEENEETPDYAFYYLERHKPGLVGRAMKFLAGVFRGPGPTG